jgi:hypothetical protein
MFNSRMSQINKLFIILIMILIMIVFIYNYSYKSTFKRRRSVPSIYFNGNIYSAYGSIGNPYMLLQGNQGYPELPPFRREQGAFPAPNADMLLYGQNSPDVNSSIYNYGPSASMIYNTM